MFIITVGAVQVVGGPDDSIVFVTLGEGIYHSSLEYVLIKKNVQKKLTINSH